MAEYDRVITGPLIDGYAKMAIRKSVYVSLTRWHETPGDAIYALGQLVFELNGLIDPDEQLSIGLRESGVVSVKRATGKELASSSISGSRLEHYAFGDNVEEFWEFVSKVINTYVILSYRSVAAIHGSQGQVCAEVFACEKKEKE